MGAAMTDDKKEKSSKLNKKSKEHKHKHKFRSKVRSKDRDQDQDKDLADQQAASQNTTNALTHSPFSLITASLYVSLPPIASDHALEAVCLENLSPLVLNYHPPFKGVVLSYHHPRLTGDPSEPSPSTHGAENDERPIVLARCVDECALPFVWVTAEFLLFRPAKDQWLDGFVNLHNEDHLSLICYNWFNVTIERKRLPSEWTWIGFDDKALDKKRRKKNDGSTATDVQEVGGHYQDRKGRTVSGQVKFRVGDFEAFLSRDKNFITLQGTMLSQEEEMSLDEEM